MTRVGMRRGGFTIVEVLLVLALLAIIAAMVGTGAVGMIEAAKMEPPDRVLKRAVLDAVYHASDRKERATFEVTDATGQVLAKHAVYQDMPTDAEDDDEWEDLILPEVSFLAEGPLAGESGGATQVEDEHLVLKRIRFQAGVSPPFQAKVIFAGKEEIFNFDPFSGYVIVEEDD